MFRKGINVTLLVLLVIAVIFVSTSCKKLKISNLRANYYFSQGNTNFSENNWRDAIESYETALIYNPNLVEAYRFLGESYKSLYNPAKDTPENTEMADKALETLTRAYEIDPMNKEIIYSLGDMYDRLKNFEEAEKLYLKIIEMEPVNMSNYYVVAGFYKRFSGEREELSRKAEELYIRRIEVDPAHSEGYAYLAQFYDEIKPIPEFDKANKFHMLLTKMEPENHLNYYAMGVNRFFKAYRLQNVLSKPERIKLGQESEEALKKAIEQEPGYSFSYSFMNMLFRNVFARVYPERAQRYLDEAERWHQRFLEIRKKEVERERLEQELRRTE